LGPFGEDSVRLLRIGETVIEVVKPCSRCVVTTTDQDTAERGREPLRTLATYRTRERGIQFGQHCVPRTRGTLTVGGPVGVIGRKCLRRRRRLGFPARFPSSVRG